MDKADRLLRIKEVADILSVSEGTVYNLVNRGELKFVHISNRRRVRASDLEKFIKSLGKVRPRPSYDIDEITARIERDFPG